MHIIKLISLIVYLNILLSETLPGQCTTLIQMEDIGVEGCSLPVIVETHQILLPCVAPDSFWIDVSVGEQAYIDYILHPGCANICQLGLNVEITCYNLITGIQNSDEENVIRLFPTLAHSTIVIEGKNINSVTIFNSNGIPVIQKIDWISGILDVSELEPGIYFARLRTSSSSRINKFIKM